MSTQEQYTILEHFTKSVGTFIHLNNERMPGMPHITKQRGKSEEVFTLVFDAEDKAGAETLLTVKLDVREYDGGIVCEYKINEGGDVSEGSLSSPVSPQEAANILLNDFRDRAMELSGRSGFRPH